MNQKKFEELMAKGTVRKQTPNPSRAQSLIEEAGKKKAFLELTIKSIPEKKMNPNFIADTCYDILIELIRAKMLFDGFSTGNSHEAEVSYMQKIGFDENETRIMDELRYYRNGTKYYGTILTKEYSVKTLAFLRKIEPRLKKMLMK